MIRTRGWKAVTAALCVLTLTATAAACSSKDNDSSSSNAPGVTADTIKIGVGVADLDGLIAQGMALPPSLTTSKLAQRVTTGTPLAASTAARSSPSSSPGIRSSRPRRRSSAPTPP